MKVSHVVGVDEAGRGPLAGPVAVGAVSIRKGERLIFRGLRDSKKLTEKDRELWFLKIKNWEKEGKLRFAVSLVSNSVIDSLGIVPAIRLGVDRCLKKLKCDPSRTSVLLDGALKAPVRFSDQKTIIRGDESVPLISLASIAAKVTRDIKMKQLSVKYPKYGFGLHKGYGTLTHRKALHKHGKSPIHRKSFLKSFDN